MMRLRKMMLACTALPLVAAFENETGWKMDGDKIATDANGDPIYIGADGKEQSIAHDAIARRNAEAKQHRERAERAEADLAKYKGSDGKMLDPATAFKAVETVANIDAKKLIDAGEVEKVKEDIKRQFEQQLTEKDTALSTAQQRIDAMLVDSVFKGSEFITERVAMPRDFFEAAMRNNFKVEDGNVVAYDKAGNRLMSKKTPGDYADTEEALELLVDTHPQKDTILKAPEGGGTGGGGGGGNRGTGRRMSRADFEKLPAHQQAEAAGAMGKGELTITD